MVNLGNDEIVKYPFLTEAGKYLSDKGFSPEQFGTDPDLKKIVDNAIKAGAEIIKHQTHIPEDEMSLEAKKISPGNSKKNIFDIISSNSLNEEEEFKLFKSLLPENFQYFSLNFFYR